MFLSTKCVTIFSCTVPVQSLSHCALLYTPDRTTLNIFLLFLTNPHALNLLPELSISQQLLHHGSLPVLLGNTGMIEIDWVVHHRSDLCQIQINNRYYSCVYGKLGLSSSKPQSLAGREHVNGVFIDLKIFGKAISVILLVEPLGIQGASHLQNLKVSFQLLSDLWGFHIEPTISC